MTKEQMDEFLIKVAVAELPQGDRERVKEAVDKINAVVAEYGQHGEMAIAVVGSHVAAQA